MQSYRATKLQACDRERTDKEKNRRLSLRFHMKGGRNTLIRYLAEENLKVLKNEMDKFSPWNEKRRALPITKKAVCEIVHASGKARAQRVQDKVGLLYPRSAWGKTTKLKQ